MLSLSCTPARRSRPFGLFNSMSARDGVGMHGHALFTFFFFGAVLVAAGIKKRVVRARINFSAFSLSHLGIRARGGGAGGK